MYYLLYFLIEKVIRKVTVNSNGAIFNRMIQYLAYADDVVIINRTETDLQSAVSQLYAEAKENGLIINGNKSKYMIKSRNKERWKNKQNIVTNSQVLFHNGSLLHSKHNR
jgi:hypothetical protein